MARSQEKRTHCPTLLADQLLDMSLSALYEHTVILPQKRLFSDFTFRPTNFQYRWVVFQFRGLKHIWINRTAKLQSQPYASMVVHAQSGTVRKHTVICACRLRGSRHLFVSASLRNTMSMDAELENSEDVLHACYALAT